MAKAKIKGIYGIDINGKKYIGQDSAVMTNNRLGNHLSFLRRGIHHNKRFQEDYDTYGEEFLTYTIYEFSKEFTKDDLNEKEKYYIDKFKSFDKDHGYNQTLGGIGMLGYVCSPELLEVRSIMKRGEKNDNSKISNEQFYEIVELFKQGMCNDEIAKIYGLHSRYVSLIRHKKRYKSFWNTVPDYIPVKSHEMKDKRLLDYEKFCDIMKMIESGCTNKDIETKYKLSSGSGSRIRHKKLYKDFWDAYKVN